MVGRSEDTSLRLPASLAYSSRISCSIGVRESEGSGDLASIVVSVCFSIQKGRGSCFFEVRLSRDAEKKQIQLSSLCFRKWDVFAGSDCPCVLLKSERRRAGTLQRAPSLGVPTNSSRERADQITFNVHIRTRENREKKNCPKAIAFEAGSR